MKNIYLIILSLLNVFDIFTLDKLTKSFRINDLEVWTDSGWQQTPQIHETKPFIQYTIKTTDKTITCADNHIFVIDGLRVFAKDLKIGDHLQTIDGYQLIISITKNYIPISMCDLTVNSSDHTYFTNGVLSHNTTTSAIFMLHYILFNVDKNALVLGNKRKTAVEILSKCKSIFLEIPFFLKPGIYKWNESEIVLDNGCRLMAEATTINSGISFTFHCVLADEFGHIQNTILDRFYNNLFPTITAARARFMITSTQNGYNLFYRLYKAAEAGENEYAPFKVDWWQVPEWNPDKRCWEKRDEAWHQRQVANYGSEEAFNKQFGTNFDIAANTLISLKILSKKAQKTVEFISKDLPGAPYVEHWLWHPLYDPTTQLRKDKIIITCDLAEGGGGDYTTFMVHRMIEPGTEKLECVGMFRANTLDREACALALQTMCSLYCSSDNLLVSYERNSYGEAFLYYMFKNMETNPIIMKGFDQSCLVKFYNDTGKKYEVGVKITPGNKTMMCNLYKEDYERDIFINDCALYHVELGNFTNDGSDHFRAAFGHDDMVMATIQLEKVKTSLQYKLMRQDFDEGKEKEQMGIYNPYEGIYNPYEGMYDQMIPQQYVDMWTSSDSTHSRLR